MSSNARIPRIQILRAEFQMMLSKETEVRDLYSGILERVENNYISKKIMSIRDDKIMHMGYVEIMLNLLGIEE
jgi:rubrerythrin